MSGDPNCKNPGCIDGWLYGSFGGGMVAVFPLNERCPDCNPEPKPDPQTQDSGMDGG